MYIGVDGDTLLRIRKDDLKADFMFSTGEAITLYREITQLRGYDLAKKN